jgi:hypothetical protein
MTRTVLGQAGGVVGDAAQRFADGQRTTKTKVGQVSTVGVSTSESTPSFTAKTPTTSASFNGALKGLGDPVGPASLMRDTTLRSSVLEWKRLPCCGHVERGSDPLVMRPTGEQASDRNGRRSPDSNHFARRQGAREASLTEAGLQRDGCAHRPKAPDFSGAGTPPETREV